MAAARVLIGTSDGLHVLGSTNAIALAGRTVDAIALDAGARWAIVDGEEVWREPGDGSWTPVAKGDGRRLTCLLPTPGGGLLVGTAEAHLLRLADEGLRPVDGFDTVDGRADWYTPWGGPPDVRSLAGGPAGELYVNVHVGGIARSDDGGGAWSPTIDIHTDVHQVLAPGDASGAVLAACGDGGLAVSHDRGASWEFRTDGLHGTYCRAVAVAGDTVLVSASTGPSTTRAAVYRAGRDGSGAFERCRAGLPEWFAANVDTGCLAAAGHVACFVAGEGAVFLSEDEGRSWRRAQEGLGRVHAVALDAGAAG